MAEVVQPGQSAGIAADKIQSYFDRLHRLADELETATGELKADIKNVYDEAADALDVPAKVLKRQFRMERSKQKDDAKLADWDREHVAIAEAIANAREQQLQLALDHQAEAA